MSAIHQLVAGFRQNDAISNESLCLQSVFRGWGHPSEIGCERHRTDPQARHAVRDASELTRALLPDDLVLLHLSTGTPLNALFAGLNCRKVILYHNITPPAYFGLMNPVLSAELAEGRRQVAVLAGTADMTLADSRFNADDLRDMGYRQVAVFPLVLDFSRLTQAIDPTFQARFADGALNVLFVGRCVPNKRIESLLRVMHALQRTTRRHCRLLHVGSHAGAEVYFSTLLAQARELALQDIQFLGPLNQPQLNACFAAANVFVCLSEHEGFCVPLIEAMVHDLPIVALKRAAVPETLGAAGIQFDTFDPALVAETILMLDSDAAFRQSVIATQQARLQAYADRNPAAELRSHFKSLPGLLP